MFEIWGSPSGSSMMRVTRDQHNRIKMSGSTDFGESHCIFTDEQAREIRNALNQLLGDL